MIFPKRLNSGDVIGVFAPSSPVNLNPAQVNQGYKYIESKGFKVLKAKNLLKITGHTAGSIKDRVDSIHKFFIDKNVKAIMSFWGGYNSNDLLEYLDYDLIKSNPKIFIGYSDLTVLNNAITKRTGLITFSGPSVISFAKPEPFNYTWENFLAVTASNEPTFKLKTSKYYADDSYFLRKDKNHRIIKKNNGLKMFSQGSAIGKVIGGNLQSLLVLAGTRYFPELKNSILFLEEAEEVDVPMIYRFLTQLSQLKDFSKINGIVLGRFTEQSGFKEGEIKIMLKQIFGKCKIPIMYDADFGHSDPMFTIPIGGQCAIDTKSKSIVFKRSVV